MSRFLAIAYSPMMAPIVKNIFNIKNNSITVLVNI